MGVFQWLQAVAHDERASFLEIKTGFWPQRSKCRSAITGAAGMKIQSDSHPQPGARDKLKKEKKKGVALLQLDLCIIAFMESGN